MNQPVTLFCKANGRLLYSWERKRCGRLPANFFSRRKKLSSFSLRRDIPSRHFFIRFDPPFLLRSVNGLTRASSVRSMVFAFERRHVGRKRMKFHLIRKGKHSPRTYSLAIVISPISRLSRGSTVKPGLLIPRAFCLQSTCASLHPTCPIQTGISNL